MSIGQESSPSREIKSHRPCLLASPKHLRLSNSSAFILIVLLTRQLRSTLEQLDRIFSVPETVQELQHDLMSMEDDTNLLILHNRFGSN